MKRTDPQFKMRLPPALKETLESSASAASRTLSSEIIRRLEWSIAAADDFTAYESKTDARSELALSRLLDPAFPGGGGPIQARLKAVEDQVAHLTAEIEKLKRRA